uniref:Uncharacterized protein n=1 Tax=Biomphalaria glabrata TaxID=6526 RepID=A0A2C9LPD3_BIOGL
MRRTVYYCFSLRNLLSVFVALVLVYILGYLLLTTPISKRNGKPKFLDIRTGVQEQISLTNSEVPPVVDEGYGAWIQGRSIEIMSAIKDLHHLNKSENRIVLIGFLQHTSNRNFVCCFRNSLESSDVEQVPAALDYIDLRFIVNFQNAVFSCLTPMGSNSLFNFVSFAPESCTQNMSSSLKIVYPVPRSFELAVCTKEMMLNFSDGSGFRLDPILMPPEWAKVKAGGLYHWQFNSGTYIAPYCRKWIYLPKHTWLASTHENIPKKGFKTYVIPSTLVHFLHFRSCKLEWQGIPCRNLSQTVQNERLCQCQTFLLQQHLNNVSDLSVAPASSCQTWRSQIFEAPSQQCSDCVNVKPFYYNISTM